MREISFRAKAVNRDKGYHRTTYKNGDWVYGLITRPYNNMFPTLPMEMRDTEGINGIEVDYKTVGQFTGLTDKNGKKIFEGDIVTGRFLHAMSVKSVIAFRNGAFGLLWDRAGAETFDAFTSLCNIEYEVIGNIHDNPELLEGENGRKET